MPTYQKILIVVFLVAILLAIIVPTAAADGPDGWGQQYPTVTVGWGDNFVGRGVQGWAAAGYYYGVARDYYATNGGGPWYCQ